MPDVCLLRHTGGRKNANNIYFRNGNNRAIRLLSNLDFEGESELEIVWESGSSILRLVRPSWSTFLELEKADPNFMAVLRGHRI